MFDVYEPATESDGMLRQVILIRRAPFALESDLVPSVGTSAATEVLPFPIGWWDDIALNPVWDRLPRLLYSPYSIAESDYNGIVGYAPAMDRAKRAARARQFGFEFDRETGLIVASDKTPDALIEPWMVRESDFKLMDKRGKRVAMQLAGEQTEQLRETTSGQRLATVASEAIETSTSWFADKLTLDQRLKKLALSVAQDPAFWAALGATFFWPKLGWIPLASFGLLKSAKGILS